MKYCFSTIGCPDWSFDEIFAAAVDLGMDGIELRGIGKTLDVSAAEPFSDANIAATLERFSAAGIEIPIFSSGAQLALPEKTDVALNEAKRYIALAQISKTPYVRVTATIKSEPLECDLAVCLENYKYLCSYAETRGVGVLMETNGALGDSSLMRRLMERVNSPAAGVLWDINHPVRFFGETPEQTAENIGPYVRFVHIKDSALENGRIAYKMLGSGTLPLAEAMRCLVKLEYGGYISLEWIKRWERGLEEPGVVFSHFRGYMRRLMKQVQE